MQEQKIYIPKRSKKTLATIILLVCSVCGFSQQYKIDSLKNVLRTAKADTNKVITWNLLTKNVMAIGNYDSALVCANDALALSNSLIGKSTNTEVLITLKKGAAIAITNIGIIHWAHSDFELALKNYYEALYIRESINDKNAIAGSYNNIANVHSQQGNYGEALKNQFIVLKIREEIAKESPNDATNKKGLAASYNNIGSIYWNQGSYPEALKNYLNALKLFEELGDVRGTSSAYDGIGIVYYSQHNYDEALKNQTKALKIKEELGDKFGLAATYNNIGGICEEKGDYEQALKNYTQSLRIREELGDQQGIAGAYANIANISLRDGNYQSGIENLNKALKILETIGDQQGIASIYNDFGSAFLNKKGATESDLTQAITYFEKSLPLAKTVGSKEDIKSSYEGLASAFEKKAFINKGNAAYWEKSHLYYKQFILYRDSLVNEENTKKTVQAQMNYEFDKKEENAKIEQAKKDVIVQEEKQKQKLITWFVAAGLLFMVIFAIFIFKSLKTTRSQKQIIEKQKETVEEKQKEIIDSINYAKRIQQSILPTETYINKNLPH